MTGGKIVVKVEGMEGRVKGGQGSRRENSSARG